MRGLGWTLACAAAAIAVGACSTDDASLTGDAGSDDAADAASSHGEAGGEADGSATATDAAKGDANAADAGGGGDAAAPGDASVADGAPVDASAGDAASKDAAPQDAAPLEAGVCNLLVNTAPSVPETDVASAAPAPQGGTVVVGRYYLTQWQVFTGQGGVSGPTGNTRKYVIDLHANGTYDEVIADNGNPDEHYTRTWSTQGTFFNSTQLCPTMEPLGDDYTATATTLTLSAYGVVMTFTKQ